MDGRGRAWKGVEGRGSFSRLEEDEARVAEGIEVSLVRDAAADGPVRDEGEGVDSEG